MRDIGKNIRYARIRKKMTQDELAEKLFVTRQTVSNYENGKSRPDIEILISVSKILEVELEELLYGGEEHPERKRERIKLVIAACIGVSIFIMILAFSPILHELFKYKYIIWPIWVIDFLIVPALMGLLGWIVMQAGNVFLNLKKPNFKLKKYVHIVLVAVCCIAALLAIAVIIIAITPQAFTINIAFATRSILFLSKYPFVCMLIGAAMWLTEKNH